EAKALVADHALSGRLFLRLDRRGSGCARPRRCAALVPLSVANRTDFQTHEIDPRLGRVAQEAIGQLSRLAAWETADSAAAGTTARRSRAFFPLGLRVGCCAAAIGGKSASCTASWWRPLCLPQDWPRSCSGGRSSHTTSLTRPGNENGKP